MVLVAAASATLRLRFSVFRAKRFPSSSSYETAGRCLRLREPAKPLPAPRLAPRLRTLGAQDFAPSPPARRVRQRRRPVAAARGLGNERKAARAEPKSKVATARGACGKGRCIKRKRELAVEMDDSFGGDTQCEH